jgi:circadian clock protein KaiC
MVVIERIESGIPGLDKLMQGGFVKGSINMIAGATGTGKTIFCCQYMWHGLKKGENTVYLTLEEPVEDILTEAAQFGMDFTSYIKKKRCAIVYLFPKTLDELEYEIFKRIKDVNAKRFVIDSLSLLAFSLRDENLTELRTKIYEIFKKLKQYGVTSVVVSEVPEESKGISRFGFEEFISDSVLVLHYLEYAGGGLPRSLIIRKMRKTKHSDDILPIKIDKTGLVVRK